VSPFNRTRQTAEIIQTTIANFYDEFCIVYFDKEVEEFLGFQKPKYQKADISKFTNIYTHPRLGVENLEDCKRRIINFYKGIEKEENIWVITHGILMSYLYHHLNGEKRNFSYLEYLEGKKTISYSAS
jgi:broad specificity phosphatase PhoE